MWASVTLVGSGFSLQPLREKEGLQTQDLSKVRTGWPKEQQKSGLTRSPVLNSRLEFLVLCFAHLLWDPGHAP